MAELELDRVIEQYHLALDELVKGDPEPVLKIFSQRDDVSLANPVGPAVRGRKPVEETVRRAVAQVRDGEPNQFENLVKYVTPDLAFFVWVERFRARIGGRQEMTPVALRVTVIFRPEDGTWKLLHRHADPIASEQPMESVIQK
jgi:ketosteroid isomerase-like protein